jgi:hypothetical protein
MDAVSQDLVLVDLVHLEESSDAKAGADPASLSAPP